jgi:prepilin signal peptidase PulO-like enzyme (type II secretory pathway)
VHGQLQVLVLCDYFLLFLFVFGLCFGILVASPCIQIYVHATFLGMVEGISSYFLIYSATEE